MKMPKKLYRLAKLLNVTVLKSKSQRLLEGTASWNPELKTIVLSQTAHPVCFAHEICHALLKHSSEHYSPRERIKEELETQALCRRLFGKAEWFDETVWNRATDWYGDQIRCNIPKKNRDNIESILNGM